LSQITDTLERIVIRFGVGVYRGPTSRTQLKIEKPMFNHKITALALTAALGLGTGTAAFAQGDCGALIDTLVRKKILTAQEGEEVRADLIKESGATNAGKLNLSSSITELKLYGDMRLREQYDNYEPQVPVPQSTVPGSTATGNPQHGAQENRLRFRLRVGADVKLGEHWFGGFGLQTNAASDSGNQTFDGAFPNYGIYIDRAFVGWRNDWLMAEGGKFSNPFYTTDLVWDPDINPDGFAESIAFHNLFSTSETGYSKDGKTVFTTVQKPRWELTLNLGELIYGDNKEDTFGGYRWNTDVWMFVAQMVAGFQVTPDVKLTVAPGGMTWIAGNLNSANDAVPLFNQPATELVNGKLINTTTPPYSAVGDLMLITAPGDVSFKLAGVKVRVLWDFAYNTEGRARDARELSAIDSTTHKISHLTSHSNLDDRAWLAGFALGENKEQGDFSFFANFRQVGIAAIDPNINDSDFALSYMNVQGYKVGVAYNITNFCVGAVTWYDAWNLRKNLTGGEATKDAKIANANQVQVLQVDLNVKF